MKAPFWSYTIYYVILSIITIVMLAAAVVKSKNRGLTIVCYFAALGMTCYFEAGIMFLFNSYAYYPNISNSPSLENLAGNYFSQTSVSAAAVLITVLSLPFYYYFIAAGIYYIVEELFIKLGIYSHMWYRAWMTSIWLLLLFLIVKKAYEKLEYSDNKLLHYVTLFFSIFGLYGLTIYKLLSVDGFVRFNKMGIDYSLNPIYIKDPYYTNGWGFFLYCIPHIIVMIILIHIKVHMMWKTAGLFALFIEHYVLFRLSILAVNGSNFFLVTCVLIFSMYSMAYIFDKLLERGKVRGRKPAPPPPLKK